MKNTILLLMMTLLFTGCLEEGTDGCPSYISLTFLHNNDIEEFDSKIGNDIQLQIYKDEILYSSKIIPYQEIEGGKKYQLRKEVDGEISLVAWAIPSSEESDGAKNPIPQPTVGEMMGDKVVQLPTLPTRSENEKVEGIQNLFLGLHSYSDPGISVPTECEVSLASCVCLLSVTIVPEEEFYTDGQEEEVRLEISGTKKEMDLFLNPKGEDAIVHSGLTYDVDSQMLFTGEQGLLPSDEDQLISIKAFKGDTHVFSLHTNEKSVPGTVITIEIVRKTATLYVNGWRVKNANMEWL